MKGRRTRSLVHLMYWCLYAGLLCLTASAQKPELVVQTGYPSLVSVLAFSPDGRIVAGGGGAVKLWDVASGKQIRTLTGCVSYVFSVAFSPDGKTLATDCDNEVILREVATGSVKQRISVGKSVYGVAFVRGGQTLVSRSGESVQLWDLTTGKEIGKFPSEIKGDVFAFTPDNKILVSLDKHAIRVVDAATGQEIRTLGNPGENIVCASLSADGKTLATGSEEKTVRVWNVATGQEMQSFPQHTGKVRSVAFNPRLQMVASASEDKTVKLWDPATGKQNLAFKGPSEEVYSLAFSPDGKVLATGGKDIQLWDVSKGKEIRILRGYFGNITTVEVSPNKRLLASGDKNGTIKLWDLAGKELRTLTGHTDSVLSVAFSPDSTTLASGGADKKIELWSVATGRQMGTFPPQAANVDCVAFSRDGKLASATSDSVVKLWDPATSKEIRSFVGQGSGFNCVAFSPDGGMLASVTAGELLNRVVELWDVATGAEIRKLLPGHMGDITSVAFHPGVQMLATRGVYDRVKLWDVSTGKQLQELSAPGGWLNQIAFSADGRFFAKAGDLGKIQIYDLKTGKVMQTISIDDASSVAFTADGEVLTGGSGPSVHLWDVQSGRELAALFAFSGGNWAVVDPEGRYDGSDAGHVGWLHWVSGDEPIELDQLKERYYEPGLLGKVMGFNKEPLLDVDAFTSVALYPEASLTTPQGEGCKLGIHLTNRGGGIGRVAVWVNGKEVAADARGNSPNPQAQRLDVTVDVSKSPFLKAGQENAIEVRVFNAENYVSSRNVQALCRAPGEGPLVRPSFWAIVAGISDYAGKNIRLQYAGKDAADMAEALRIGAERLFGTDHTHITLLTTTSAPGAVEPTRENLRKAFEAARQAKNSDILVVYLAGHGVNFGSRGSQEEDYYYLTREARTGDLTDPAVRAQTAVSSRELTDWIKQIPALKQTLVLDTCAAARLVQKLTEKRDISSSQIRSLERMKDRMGLFILAGSAADAVSYEASQFGQGLLTYSLLLGMRGAALREDRFVDVSKWFDFATDEVPQLARDIGGIQKPERYTPCRPAQQTEQACGSSATWDIGQLLNEDKARIPLATPRPVFLQSSFQDELQLRDHLKLTALVNEALRETSSRGREATLVFVDAADFPDAYSLAGRYRVEGSTVTAKVAVFKGEKQVGDFTLVGEAGNLDKLTAGIVSQAERLTNGSQ